MYPNKNHLSCKEYNSLTVERKALFNRLDEFVEFLASHPEHIKSDLRYYITRVWFDDPICQDLDFSLMKTLKGDTHG